MERFVKLGNLVKGIKGVEVRGSKEVEIKTLCSDSRISSPGCLFIAKKGEKYDGSQFIQEAVNGGAKAFVTNVYDPFISLPQIICENPAAIEAVLAARFFQRPSKKLFVVGVTGSKGKTTTTYLIRHLLEGFQEKCGLIGTVEIIAGERRQSSYTTHDAISNQKLLNEMVLQKCSSAVLEVSSHGLSQDRVAEIDFDIGVFTNLYPDHLDYHKTIEHYAASKRKLFDLVSGIAIVNGDSPWAPYMRGKTKGLTFGMDGQADIRAKEVVASESGISFTVDSVLFESRLMGFFNVYNLLASIAVGVAKGKSLKEISAALKSFPGVPGRLEKIENKKGIHVFVDYAHTGESLENVLSCLKTFAKKRIIVVFGCGGNRDKARRKEMAMASQKYADAIVVTSDNPRTEDPEQICRDILQGFSSLKNVVVEPDRKGAIAKAIGQAKEGDFVLIAGKGHEKVQIFLNQTVTFDDVAVAKEILAL